jgi:hypothetical protein
LILCACGGGRPGKSSPPPATGGPAPPRLAKGTYPAPVTKFQGRTATYWGEKALDADVDTSSDAAERLHRLGAEGTPFLLAAAERQREEPANLYWSLLWLDGSLVADADLPAVASFLDERYARHDATYHIRGAALDVLAKAGPRARPFLPRVRELADVPGLERQAAEATSAIDR